jgi:8-oxo-dGTP pyrophosphatase MutT (NUDIX family)
MERTFTALEFSNLAKSKLLQQPPQSWDHSDDDMNQKARMIPEGIQPKAASVLVPIVMRSEGLTLLLTQRTETLSKHAGQVAFPGGKQDLGETALDTALRETFEETGLHQDFIAPQGYLKGYLTVTGYLVTPVVALVREGFALVPQQNEVASIFEVPLHFLLNPNNRQTHSRDWNGLMRHYFVYQYQNRHIWGATAGMIKSMEDMLLS